MSAPPPPPQVSADGKFYWDGQRLGPDAAAGRRAARRGEESGSDLASGAQHRVCRRDRRHRRHLYHRCGRRRTRQQGDPEVGRERTRDPDLAHRWLRLGSDHGKEQRTEGEQLHHLSELRGRLVHAHVITANDGGCSINKDLEHLECGPLESGATKTVNIDGSPKDAGNFNFEAAAADQEGSDLLYPEQDGVLTWSEAVTS